MTHHVTYERMTLADLIGQLEDINESPVQGLSGNVFSYRGFYERNCTEPSERVATGAELAKEYANQVGQTMYGWKGGDFITEPDHLIYYSTERDTGPCVIGLECGDDGTYRPVLLAHDDHFDV